MQVPGGDGGCADVVAALDDHARNLLQLVGVTQQLVVGVEETGIDEIMVLDAREGEREMLIGVARRVRLVRQQGDGAAFPHAPRLGGADLLGAVAAGQALVIGGHQVAALSLRDRRQESLPQFGEHPGCAVLVVPQQLLAPQGEDAAHHQLGHAHRMGLGIGERKGAAPGAAEHQPLLDAHQGAQALDVGDQVPGGVVVEAGMRTRAAAAALVEQQHAILVWIEQPAMLGRAAGARAAMQEDRRLALGVAADFPIDLVAIAGVEMAGVIGLDLWVEATHRFSFH